MSPGLGAGSSRGPQTAPVTPPMGLGLRGGGGGGEGVVGASRQR